MEGGGGGGRSAGSQAALARGRARQLSLAHVRDGSTDESPEDVEADTATVRDWGRAAKFSVEMVSVWVPAPTCRLREESAGPDTQFSEDEHWEVGAPSSNESTREGPEGSAPSSGTRVTVPCEPTFTTFTRW
jgi:hypothetical protein